VPFYNEVASSERYSDAQLNVVVTLQYFCAFLFAIQFCTVIYNTYTFMLRKRRLDNLSIIGFYLLIVLLTSLRFYYCMWFLYERANQHVTTLLLVPIVKINMGFVMCWMLLELSLYIE